MHKRFLAAATFVSLAIAGSAGADGEVTFVFGASISGDISALNDEFDFDDVQTAVKNTRSSASAWEATAIPSASGLSHL
jgi:hypothetical protein